MLWMLNRKVGGLELGRLTVTVMKMLAAAGVMMGACAALEYLPGYPHGKGMWAASVQLAALMAVGGGVYVGVCSLLGFGVMSHVLPRRARRIK